MKHALRPMGIRMPKKVQWKNVTVAIVALVLISGYARFIFNSSDDGNTSVFWPRDTSAEQMSKGEEMRQRTNNMRMACSQYPVRRQLKAGLGGGKRLFYVSDKYQLSYCRVAKVGSTFWTQVFMTLAGIKAPLNDEDGDQSMFNVPRDEAHQEMKKHADLTMNLNDKRVHETTSFLVARNPYSRLFSSYIDQIYLPNKWEMAAKMVPEKKRQECGNDVTFDEFLSSITTKVLTKGNMDLHWAPVFSICLPCETNVQLLAKQETFNDDAEFILNTVGVEQPIRNEVKRAVGDSLYETAIPTLVHTYVTKGHNIKKGCISESQLAEKIWTAFHFQGYIHNDYDFPAEKFKSVDASNIETVLTQEILAVIKKHRMGSIERNTQRQNWKVDFWKKVSLATLQKVQDAYYEDFFVFQYDLDPRTM